MVQDDGSLIRATRKGDARAFETLVRRYQDRLLTALASIAGSRDEAEDVAQEAFVTAYVKLDKFDGDSSFYTWLYRIAMNNAVSRLRKRRIESSVEHTRDLTGSEPYCDREMAEDQVLRQERAAQVHRALSMMPQDFRAVLVLREMEGCDYDTIAQILDLPVGTVRSRLHRARMQLKEQLSEVLKEHPEQ